MKAAWAIAWAFIGAVHAADEPLRSGVFEPARVAPPFTLAGSDGHELRLDRYRGKVVILGFGFSHCPEICPTTLAKLAKARKQMGAAARDVQVVYITVDPERDTPEQLRGYLTLFDPTFIGGSGTPAQLAAVFKDYGIKVTRYDGRVPGEYGYEHSTFVYLVDPAGRIRAMAPYGERAEDIAHDAAILLKK